MIRLLQTADTPFLAFEFDSLVQWAFVAAVWNFASLAKGSPQGTDGKSMRRRKKTPCGDRGYDATGHVESSADADDQKWRRRESNPRPEIWRRKPLRV